MLGIDLGYYHRNIGSPSVGTVIRYYRGLCPGISFFDCLDLVLGHIYGTKYEIYLCGYFFHFVDIHDDQLFHSFRHGSRHLPSIPHCILIRLACGSGAGCDSRYLEPWMVL